VIRSAIAIVAYFGVWAFFHSALASLTIKRWVRRAIEEAARNNRCSARTAPPSGDQPTPRRDEGGSLCPKTGPSAEV
jgi:hypothetical protein